MKFSYTRSDKVSKTFDISGRIVILRGMSSKEEVDFCASLEKAFSSDPLESCDDWDKRKEGHSGDTIIGAEIQDGAATYGFSINDNGSVVPYTSDKLVYGVRYIGGSNYSCFTSVTEDESIESIMSVSAEANPSKYNRLSEVYAALSDEALFFMKDLFADIDRKFSDVRKVLIVPKISVISAEIYSILAYALASVRNANLIVLSEVPELSQFAEDFADEIQYVE